VASLGPTADRQHWGLVLQVRVQGDPRLRDHVALIVLKCSLQSCPTSVHSFSSEHESFLVGNYYIHECFWIVSATQAQRGSLITKL
jgi:hypothetical protein